MFSWGSGGNTYNCGQVIDMAQRRLNEIRGEKQSVDQEMSTLQREQSALEQELAKADRDVAHTLLPQFEAGALAQLALLVGLPPLATEPIQLYNDDLRRTQARLAELNADEEFVRREDLLNPDYGSLSTGLAEVERHLAALRPTLDPCETHPRWSKLLESGYGTPTYAVGWWRLSYYSNWKAGDEIEDRHGGKPFAEILESYKGVRASADVLQARRDALQSDVARVQAKIDEHEQLAFHLREIVPHHLEKTRERLLGHLRGLQPEDLPETTRQQPALRTLLARWFGLRAKIDYLGQLRRAQLGALSDDLARERAQLERTITKLSRPKNSGFRLSQADADKRYLSRGAKIQSRLQRHTKVRDRIVTYNHYEYVDMSGPLLWWDVFQDGRDQGAYLPSVSRFRSQNSSYSYSRWQPDDESYAAAAAADLDARDDLSFTDAS